MAFVMESRELGEPLLYIVFRKNKWQIFLKNEQNTLFLWSFFAQIWVKINFSQKLGSIPF